MRRGFASNFMRHSQHYCYILVCMNVSGIILSFNTVSSFLDTRDAVSILSAYHPGLDCMQLLSADVRIAPCRLQLALQSVPADNDMKQSGSASGTETMFTH